MAVGSKQSDGSQRNPTCNKLRDGTKARGCYLTRRPLPAALFARFFCERAASLAVSSAHNSTTGSTFRSFSYTHSQSLSDLCYFCVLSLSFVLDVIWDCNLWFGMIYNFFFFCFFYCFTVLNSCSRCCCCCCIFLICALAHSVVNFM